MTSYKNQKISRAQRGKILRKFNAIILVRFSVKNQLKLIFHDTQIRIKSTMLILLKDNAKTKPL